MTFLTTYSGNRIDIPNPQADQISIVDIAMHLSRLPRFCGATTYPYSVAEHSILVADLAKIAGLHPIVQLAALLHDAHEAYFSDVPSPVKAAITQWECGPNYGLGRIESRLQAAVLRRFGVEHAFRSNYEKIKHFDLVALATERKYLMHPNAMGDWAVLSGIEPLASQPKCWSWPSPNEHFQRIYSVLAQEVDQLKAAQGVSNV